MRKIMYRSICILMVVAVISMVSACSQKSTEVKKIKDLDFTVVEEADIPQELSLIISEKKNSTFKLTYSSEGEEYLYIVIGYGEQRTGGYSISVESLYLTENAIYFDTTLVGPGKDEAVTQVLSYPYIVLKIEHIDKKVVFE